MITTYGDASQMVQSLSKMAAKPLRDDYRSERLFTWKTNERLAKVHSVLTPNRRLRFRMSAHEVNVSKDTVHRNVTKELGMRKIYA
ncbi:hypothetical protein Trydic_g15835 [Trypoxylus dichotomus]